MAIDLSGRTALVTGGSRGIGKACCLLLAQAGARVAVNYATNQAKAKETVNALQKISANNTDIISFQADVSDRTCIDRLVDGVTDQLGPIDILINNAGIFDYVSHNDTTADLWDRTLATNLTSAFLLTWAVKESMIARNYGRIVNVASIAALRARPMSIAYAASKSGMIGLTKSTAEAFAEHNIRVNAIAPGLIETEILDGVAPDAKQGIIDNTPLGRIGTPEDIARLTLFLVSDESDFITGQMMVASGGRVMLP